MKIWCSDVGKAKKHLLTKKSQADLPYVIEKYDIISIVNSAWRFSFAKIGSNRHVISERGWGPLNYNCLLEAEIQLTSCGDKHLIGNTNMHPHDLNLSTGISGMLTDSIVEHRNRESARNGVNATEQIRKRKATAQTAIDNHKKLSSGLLFTSGTCRLGPEMLDKAIESKQITTNVQTAKELAAQQ